MNIKGKKYKAVRKTFFRGRIYEKGEEDYFEGKVSKWFEPIKPPQPQKPAYIPPPPPGDETEEAEYKKAVIEGFIGTFEEWRKAQDDKGKAPGAGGPQPPSEN